MTPKAKVITFFASTAIIIALVSISNPPSPITTSQAQNNDQLSSLPLPPIVDYERLVKMQGLLKNYVSPTKTYIGSYAEYKQLCSQATSIPIIGMTIDQARNTTWCFPYDRNVTTTASGQHVQEIYLKNPNNLYTDSRFADKKYLYFTNGILTTIQE